MSDETHEVEVEGTWIKTGQRVRVIAMAMGKAGGKPRAQDVLAVRTPKGEMLNPVGGNVFQCIDSGQQMKLDLP
ncbi:MAG: hypothetical protein M5U26_14845 [Planctomycetota bacterium]|nr:hypothetical protein [Planctomycetota bacterium]